MRVVTRPSAELSEPEERELQTLCERAWVAKGSVIPHVEAGAVAAHAAVVDRTLEWDGRPLRTGCVEAVATLPDGRERDTARPSCVR